MPANTPWVVADAGPRFTPLRFGLLSAAQIVDDPDPHWQQGVQFQPDDCGPDLATTAFCIGGGPATGTPHKSPTVTGTGSSAAEPFTVYAYADCAPVGWGNDVERLVARAERMLDRGENRAVERVFWTGQTAGGIEVRPHLAEDTAVFANTEGGFYPVELQSAAVVVSGIPTDVVQAFGLLEGALGSCYGGEGVIHVPAQAGPYLSRYNLASQQGPQLRSQAGHVVALYSANVRHGPTGVEPGAGLAWFYATGAVIARRSAVKRSGTRPAEFVGKAQNDTVYVVERTYVIDWDCCHFAAQVFLGGAA